LAAESLSAKEAARELGTDARNFRKFMRAVTPKEDQPGQGNRYAIPKKRIPKLKAQFEDWSKPKQKAAPTDEVDEDLTDEELEEAMISDDEDLLADEIDEDEPSEEELDEIEASDVGEVIDIFDDLETL
jgi:hypothetical protein